MNLISIPGAISTTILMLSSATAIAGAVSGADAGGIAGGAGAITVAVGIEESFFNTTLVDTPDVGAAEYHNAGMSKFRIPKNSPLNRHSQHVIGLFRGCDRCEYKPVYTEQKVR